MSLKDRSIEISRVQTRDPQVITLGHLIASSILWVAKLMSTRIAIESPILGLDIARWATK